MAVLVCSLYVHGNGQMIEPGGYRLVRFPYGSRESYDRHGMHQTRQPDGDGSTYPDERSGLIWPAADGWGDLVANIHWEAGDYTELRDRFVRDPLGLAGGEDSTGTDHRRPSPGMQCFTKTHAIFVHPDTPLGLKVAHNDDRPRRLLHAQFKLAIHV
ncbi:hypothetical protein RM572_24595 [Streptomyces sp. DSM 42041]|uniref:Uncharacterized protein n=1 Tax=Streptomyces hazeniae TaxID=3075538 RepID=A0ABU2NY70_9ACTN|nr:hypothetical protein [Streptomyces sp. DSM 42041]MDT0381946.1 hypothetical protein [Streptomyces sp. DSM 42041]